MMETSHLWHRNNPAKVGRLNFSWLRSVLLKRALRAGLVVVPEITGQYPSEMFFVKASNMVQALASD
jgi:hypothetical protein